MSAILRHLISIGWNRIILIFLFIWLIILFVMALPFFGNQVITSTKSQERLEKALSDLEALKHQNSELHEMFKEIKNFETINGQDDHQLQAIENFQRRLTKAQHQSNNLLNYFSSKEEPNAQYELLRRRIYSNTKEFWYFIQHELKLIKEKAQNTAPELIDNIEYILKLGVEHKRSLLHDINKIADVDGYATWREQESNDLSNLVQRRFHYLQNPKDCKSAKKLVCNLNKGCGYGCQLHHVVYCFMVAYGTRRTLILKSKRWRYHKAGWEDVFKPLSDNCTTYDTNNVSNWPGEPETNTVILPIIDTLNPRPPFLPLAIPEDLEPRLTRLHGDPIVWWVGQILKYLLKPQPKTAAMIQETMTKMGFKRPIVGVHVRRTDKVGTEAAYHGIEEYMACVDEYYDQLELKGPVEKRRIYLATDDPKVIDSARSKYPHYEIIGDPAISITAAVASRYSDSSLSGIISDIHMLAMSDFLVCTFSSQVCRVAYEIMQNYFPDASDRFRSLDDIYYYGGQNAHNMIAVLPHTPLRDGEMSLQPGDLVGVAGNHWNGFSKGRNLRTYETALFPSFKVQNKIETAVFPNYAEVDEHPDRSNNNMK